MGYATACYSLAFVCGGLCCAQLQVPNPKPRMA
jgi:hypothetical protein